LLNSVETPMKKPRQDERDARAAAAGAPRADRSTRTCVGCGERVPAGEVLRLVVADGEVAFDLAGGAFGRGAHVHAQARCLAATPRGLSRAYKREIRVDAKELGRRLVEACDRRMAGLLLAARRTRALALGADEALAAVRAGAPLVVVAVDAGAVASSREIMGAVAEGRAFAWKTKAELGALLGDGNVAVCAVREAGFAEPMKALRTAADAGAATMREGAGCSSPVPEAR
jgi:predicted RNA-binding protein YlxR (DUF448 family)